MKALISSIEIFDVTWVTSWKLEPSPTLIDPEKMIWVPDTKQTITNCQRVAQVVQDSGTFEVNSNLIWIDCPDECVADQWYYKDGQVQLKPQDVDYPEGE